ncbi:hypothetical protein SORBI_3001G481201 [Sorghum bicolor]|uniref:Uncharacterized protein n=1 Tax=Sorghum bicolor TaxID=4558 RepID=A0A1Z5SB24_SORBI|nr:hypothetical protein SORBI_3001G481201 [Sorghum bicolor]
MPWSAAALLCTASALNRLSSDSYAPASKKANWSPKRSASNSASGSEPEEARGDASSSVLSGSVLGRFLSPLWPASTSTAGDSSYADSTPCHEKSGSAPELSPAASSAASCFKAVDEGGVGGAGALAAGWGPSGGGGGGGEVELGPGSADVERGVVVGERGGLGGGEGAEPDADALDGVADLGGPLAPRAAPDAPVLLRGLPAPDRLLLARRPGLRRWGRRGAEDEGGLALHHLRHLLVLVRVLVELPERGLEVVGLPLAALAAGPRRATATATAASRRARDELGEDRTTTHLRSAPVSLLACLLVWLALVESYASELFSVCLGMDVEFSGRRGALK